MIKVHAAFKHLLPIDFIQRIRQAFITIRTEALSIVKSKEADVVGDNNTGGRDIIGTLRTSSQLSLLLRLIGL